ncbi:MAG: cytochrome c biogenesis protein CcsA [Acidimicrobiia bacterium]
MSTLRRYWFGATVVVALAVTAVFALWLSPPDAQQGDVVRLLYLHVPTIWVAFLGFFVTTLASTLWLVPRTRRVEWDLLAGASAEVGVVFTGITLIVGSIWGRPTWGVYWVWDARLTTTAILFFLYLGYLALRRTAATADERGKRCAIAALIAFADVPIVHFSVTWWQTLHQSGTVFNPQLVSGIHGSMAFTLIWSVGAFTVFYVYLVMRRLQLAELEEGLEERELELAIAERQRVEQMVSV